MTKINTDDIHPIPMRTGFTDAIAKITAKLYMDKLIAGWGLPNAQKIVRVLTTMLRAEKTRRKVVEN